MSVKISLAEFEALPGSLKGKFTADGESYVLQEEDVEGLKRNKTEILKELKDLKEKYGDLDPDKAKDALAKAQAAEDERLKAEGDFEKLRVQLEERHQKEIEKAQADHDSLLSNLRRESLKTLITEKYGVKSDRVRSAIAEGDLENILEFEFSEAGPKFKKKGGIGDEPELAEVFAGLKEKAGWCFESSGASGSGAQGSQAASGNSNQIKRSQYDANPMQYAAALGKGELKVVPD